MAAINLTRFEELGAQIGLEDRTVVVGMFLEGAQSRRDGVTGLPPSEIGVVAHALRSTATLLGLEDLERDARDLERAAADDRVTDEGRARVAAALDRSVAELRLLQTRT